MTAPKLCPWHPCAPGQEDTLGISQGHWDLWQRGHCAVPGHPTGPCWGGEKIFEKNFKEIVLFLKDKLTNLGRQQRDTSVLFLASICFGSRSICRGAWNRCRFLGPLLQFVAPLASIPFLLTGPLYLSVCCLTVSRSLSKYIILFCSMLFLLARPLELFAERCTVGSFIPEDEAFPVYSLYIKNQPG